MSLGKTLARLLTYELNTGDDVTPTWVPIKGLTSAKPSTDKTDADTTDFDSNGWAEHLPAQRGGSWTLEGYFIEDPATGALDPGQEALMTLGDAMGDAGLKPFRITTPGGNKWEGSVSAKTTAPGGGANNDPNAFSVELTWSGQPTFTPKP